MTKQSLCGDWTLQIVETGETLPGRLPGCSYLDLMAAGIIDDPFWKRNEETAQKLAHRDYRYSRRFTLIPSQLEMPFVELAVSGLDTLCTITINGRELAKTDNLFRNWRFDAKAFLRTGDNDINLLFSDPYAYCDARQTVEALSGMLGNKASGHLRKAPCHFGWDWGPVLPPAGLSGDITIESYATRLTDDFRISQRHEANAVTLEVSAQVSGNITADCSVVFRLTLPSGDMTEEPAAMGEDNRAACAIRVENPELWWCNGLGAQPLYTLEAVLMDHDVQADHIEKKIGLRTLTLDTEKDQWGSQFRFLINGVPIFAKGANWIPPDSFITRVTRDDYEFYIAGAAHSNMNMLRVWGGGYYAGDDFYDLCDRYGMLVWQDFIFANTLLPLSDQHYVENVHAEVIDQVRRIRNHPSLALWCGNNEIALMFMLPNQNKERVEANKIFFHRTLRDWVQEEDAVTPYWPGSPSSGEFDGKLHVMKEGKTCGDTHLWQIWHGMQKVEQFRDLPTRFCSEYGMESLPSMHTVRRFTDTTPSLFSEDMQAHQKSGGGNEKILYYMLAKYRNPSSFEDFIYLSQLVQSDAIRFATENWKRHIGRHNGALFWQYNDCWPVASWASVDYGKQYKALQYHARHFNAMVSVSNDYFHDRAELYVVNERPDTFAGLLHWAFVTLDGSPIAKGSVTVEVGGVRSSRAVVLKYAGTLKKTALSHAVLSVVLESRGTPVDQKDWLLVPDRDVPLPEPGIKTTVAVTGGTATVTLTASSFARYVYLEAEGVTAPWSDNYFDLLPGVSQTIQVQLPEGTDKKSLAHTLKVKSLFDVKPKNSKFADKLLRRSMFFKKNNFISYFIFKLFM